METSEHLQPLATVTATNQDNPVPQEVGEPGKRPNE